ncbi:hypothetical protein ACE6H2_022771 [Prunus campanulata]
MDDKSNNSTNVVNGGLPANPSAHEGRVGQLDVQDHEQGNLMDSSDGASVGFGPWNMVLVERAQKRWFPMKMERKYKENLLLFKSQQGTVKEASNDARSEPVVIETIFGNHDFMQGLGKQLHSSTNEANDEKEKHAIANEKKKIGRPKKSLINVTDSKVSAAQNVDVSGPKTKLRET